MFQAQNQLLLETNSFRVVQTHKETQASEKSYDNKLGAHASQELSGVMNNTKIKLNDVIVTAHIEHVLPSRW